MKKKMDIISPPIKAHIHTVVVTFTVIDSLTFKADRIQKEA